MKIVYISVLTQKIYEFRSALSRSIRNMNMRNRNDHNAIFEQKKFKKLRETKKSSQKSNGYETTNQIMCNQENDAQSQTNKENKTHY